MPGLVGFTDKHNKYNCDVLLNMRSLLKYSDNYVDDELFCDTNIHASRIHLDILDQGNQPYILDDRFFSWMEGEFYNQEELKTKYNVASKTDNELFVTIYHSTSSFTFLRDIDGYYAAALYDKKENKIYLITDRYGFKPLYWGTVNDNLVWSSELKGFLGYINFTPVIDHQAVQEFFNIGYLLENRTWFKDIELMPPASVLTFDLKKSKAEIQHYWAWSEIRAINGSIDEREIVEELGRLLNNAVRKRVNNNERIGVNLSGGLDSRAILAAVPVDYKPLHTFTFGQEGCDDIKIARKASKIKGAQHHTLLLNTDNWLMARINGVWKSDSSCSLLHMHGMEFHDEYKSYIDVNLNGFAGDLALGGSYLRKSHLDKKIDSLIIKDVTRSAMEINEFNDWYMINKTDPYFINNRVRRFTISGLILIAKFIEVRLPFWDNTLIDFVYSLPDHLRYGGYIYKKMLLSAFPDYYKNIPWQKIGCPISYPTWLINLMKLKIRILYKINRESLRFGIHLRDLRIYTDYAAWARQQPSRSFFEKVLLSKDAMYTQYIDKNMIHNYIRSHMGKKADYHNELCLALTFELWLKQVFEGKYRV